MTTHLQSTIAAQVGWTWRDRIDATPVVDSNRLGVQLSLGDGRGPGECDSVWHLEGQSLLAGQSATYYLDALPQTLFGAAFTIALGTVRALLIVHRAGAGQILVGGAPAAEWHAPFGGEGHAARVMPQSPWLAAHGQAGWPVTSDHAALKLAAVDGDVLFDIAILGTRVA
jgi:hypothetical protein